MKASKIVAVIALGIIVSLVHAEAPVKLSAADSSLVPGTDQQNETLVSVSPPMSNNTTERGKLLYDNHCRICHDSNVHIRNHRKAASIVDIAFWVTRWQAHLKLKWSDEDINDVVDHLDTEYYHFKGSRITK